MGIGLPLVGYVTATQKNTGLEKVPNANKYNQVDAFMKIIQAAFKEGWANGFFPTGAVFNASSGEMSIPDKNHEHRIFFDNDLENRPNLLEAFKFLKSEPAGGSLCVISIDEVTKITRDDGLLSPSQCLAIRELSRIPLVVCGRKSNISSFHHRLSKIQKLAVKSDEEANQVQDMAIAALENWYANEKRTEGLMRRCVLDQSDPLDPDNRSLLVKASDDGVLCQNCRHKLGWALGSAKA